MRKLRIDSCFFWSEVFFALYVEEFVKTTPTLQVEGFPNVFSFGDCARPGQGPTMSGYHTGNAAKGVVAPNIVKFLTGKPLATNKPAPDGGMILISKKEGMGYFDKMVLPVGVLGSQAACFHHALKKSNILCFVLFVSSTTREKKNERKQRTHETFSFLLVRFPCLRPPYASSFIISMVKGPDLFRGKENKELTGKDCSFDA